MARLPARRREPIPPSLPWPPQPKVYRELPVTPVLSSLRSGATLVKVVVVDASAPILHRRVGGSTADYGAINATKHQKRLGPFLLPIPYYAIKAIFRSPPRRSTLRCWRQILGASRSPGTIHSVTAASCVSPLVGPRARLKRPTETRRCRPKQRVAPVPLASAANRPTSGGGGHRFGALSTGGNQSVECSFDGQRIGRDPHAG